MNRYAVMARDHWARWLPSRYATISDPGRFFSDLGTRTEQRIDDLAAELAGDDRPGESYLEKAGRLGEARHRAEQIVLSEDVLLNPEPAADNDRSMSRPEPPWGLDFLHAQDQQGQNLPQS
jgi:hypothetical protein